MKEKSQEEVDRHKGGEKPTEVPKKSWSGVEGVPCGDAKGGPGSKLYHTDERGLITGPVDEKK